MGFFEKLLQDVALFSRDSPLAFVVLWLLLLVVIFLSFNPAVSLFAANKIAAVLGGVAFALAYLLYSYMASYGREHYEVLNPGVVVIALAACFLVFGSIKLIGFAFGLLF